MKIVSGKSWSNDYVGIPFADRGRTHKGCDCWGLVGLVYREKRGIVLADHGDEYETALDGDAIGEVCRREREAWEIVRVPEEFDVVLLRMMGQPWHVGIYLAGRRMLHAMHGCDAVVEDIDVPYWIPKIEGFYRYCGDRVCA